MTTPRRDHGGLQQRHEVRHGVVHLVLVEIAIFCSIASSEPVVSPTLIIWHTIGGRPCSR
jgi:hypothetical protein